MTQDPDDDPRPEEDRPAGRPSYGSAPPGPPPPPPPSWGPPPPPPPGYQQPPYGPPPGQQHGQQPGQPYGQQQGQPPYGQPPYGQQGQQGPYGQQGQGQYGDQGQYGRQGQSGGPPYGTPPPPAPGPYGPPGGPYGQQGYGGTGQPLTPADEKQWALVAHIGTILVLPVVPAIIYALFKDRGPFIHEQSKEALNFGITAFFGYVLAIIVGNILDAILWAPPLSFIVGVAIVVFAIIAAMAVNRGENYRYPLALRLVA